FLDHNALLHAPVDIEQRRGLLRIFLEGDADRAARHLAFANDRVINLDGRVDGQRETNALITAAFAGDHRIDANHFAVHIDQRASAVTGVDGGIRLNEVLEAVFGAPLE